MRAALDIITMLPREYPSGWEHNPVYEAAIGSIPNKAQFEKHFDGLEIWIESGALHTFIALCESGSSIEAAQAILSRIHRSRDTVRVMKDVLSHLWEDGDLQTYSSVLIHRPKNFRKILSIVAPILENVNYDDKKGKHCYETLGKYLCFTSWYSLRDDELSQLAGVGE